MLRGLVAGGRVTWPGDAGAPAAVLAATGSNRFLYGILLLMSVLLYRNYFYRDPSSNNGARPLPADRDRPPPSATAPPRSSPRSATRRLAKASWITALLAWAASRPRSLGAGFRQPGFLVIGFLLGLAAQGVAICATTILQQQSDDDYRGRVFSLYDMLFNVSFVAGAAVSALFMPDDRQLVSPCCWSSRSATLVAAAATG